MDSRKDEIFNMFDVLGLTKKEKELYILCLNSGPLSVSTIAKKIDVHRTAGYQLVNQLIKKGLLYKIQKKTKKTLFNSASPLEIKKILEEKRNKIDALEKKLPELYSQIKEYPEKPLLSVKTYNTISSLKQILNKALTETKNKLYLISSIDSPFNIYEERFFYSFLKEVKKRKIVLYFLVPEKENFINLFKKIEQQNSIKIKFLDKNFYPFGNGILISDNSVSIFSWNKQNPAIIEIRDETMRQTFLNLFLLLWEKLSFFSIKDYQKKSIKNMILIPGGYFYFGEDITLNKIFLDSFLIDETPVTNKEYQRFIKETKYPAPINWRNNKFPMGKANHPVINVSWYDAKSYANWAGKRLPTEEEWEKAARGTDARIFPWGNNFNLNFCNILRKNDGTTPVKKYPTGKSYYGLYDMAGNVWEWTDTAVDEEKKSYIIKGGSWTNNETTARCSNRATEFANKFYDNIGFRCAKDII